MANSKQTTVQVSGSYFEGPIPPPEVLEQFRAVDGSFPDRIMAMAERQAIHRQTEERRQGRMVVWARYLGLVFAFILVIALCGLVAYGFKLGYPTRAAGLMGTAVVSIVWAFVRGTMQIKELSK